MEAIFFGSYLVVLIFAVLICCWPAAYIAGQKNRSMLTWFFAGFLFGPMAVLMVGFSPALPPEDDEAPPPAPAAQPTMQLAVHAPAPPQAQGVAPAARPKPFCSGCGDPLASDAVFCQSCGRKAC